MTPEELEAMAVLRADYIAAARSDYARSGSPRGPACDTSSCLQLATRRVFWPVPVGEPYPLYCDTCAACARTVLERGLGVKYADEPLALREDAGVRSLAPSGVRP